MTTLQNALTTLEVCGYDVVRYGTRTFTVTTPDGQAMVGVTEKLVREIATDLHKAELRRLARAAKQA